MLSSYCRFTYSLVVVMLETTSATNLFIPMMLSMGIARGVSSLFTDSLYERSLRAKQIPLIHNSPVKQVANVKVCSIMAKEVITVPTIADMSSCSRALQSCHNAFPVVNTAGCFVGLISKNVLSVLIEQKEFYDRDKIDNSDIQNDSHNTKIFEEEDIG